VSEEYATSQSHTRLNDNTVRQCQHILKKAEATFKMCYRMNVEDWMFQVELNNNERNSNKTETINTKLSCSLRSI